MLEILRDVNVLFSRLNPFSFILYLSGVQFYKRFIVFLFLICWIILIWDLDCIVPIVHFKCTWVCLVFNKIFVNMTLKYFIKLLTILQLLAQGCKACFRLCCNKATTTQLAAASRLTAILLIILRHKVTASSPISSGSNARVPPT